MKKAKFAVLFTALVAMLGLSSCLGEPDPIQSNVEYVRVGGGFLDYSFIDIRNNRIVPTNQSAISSGINAEYALITYNYDTTKYNLTSDREVELTGLMPIETRYMTPGTGGMDDFSNAPVSALDGQLRYAFWDTENMFLPIFYFVKSYSDDDEQKSEYNSHSFNVYYDVNNTDDTARNGQLVLYLRHNVQDESLNKERTSLTYSLFHYNLSGAVSDYVAANGEKPSEIIVKFEQNSMDSDYSENNLIEGRLEINYSEILNAYQNQ